MTECLSRPGRGCMWTHVVGADTTVPSQGQVSYSYCLPCNLDGEELPCWNPGAWVGGLQVKDCQMSCSHQTRLWQPGYACTDTTGSIRKAQCFEQGAQSDSKCMFLAMEDGSGTEKTACAPCELPGTGTWGCPTTSEDGWTVTECDSQCNLPCEGPSCAPSAVTSPEVKREFSPADVMLSAPVPFMQSQDDAARGGSVDAKALARGSLATPTVPPAAYMPILMYRSPADWEAFRTPPPPAVPVANPERWPALLQNGLRNVTDEPLHKPRSNYLRRQLPH
eukprot:5193211-Amphidinium_carterae.1